MKSFIVIINNNYVYALSTVSMGDAKKECEEFFKWKNSHVEISSCQVFTIPEFGDIGIIDFSNILVNMTVTNSAPIDDADYFYGSL